MVQVSIPIERAGSMELQCGRLIYFKRPDCIDIPIDDDHNLIVGCIRKIETQLIEDPRVSYAALSIYIDGLLDVKDGKWSYMGESRLGDSIYYSPQYFDDAFFLSLPTGEYIGVTEKSLFEYLKRFPKSEQR